MVMYDEFETKENKIQTKDKIEPQFQHGEQVRKENNNNNNFLTFQILAFQSNYNTVKPVLSGHPWGMLQCPLNTGCPPNTGFDR